MYPRIEINLDKIKENAAVLLGYCSRVGIHPCAVTKAVCGEPRIAEALVEAGFTQLADSRLENITKLRSRFGETVELILLRLPMLSQCAAVAAQCDYSLHSEPAVLKKLDTQAAVSGREHRVIIMVDLGDLREGFWPEKLSTAQEQIASLSHIRVAGLGTNLTCYGGVIPTVENLSRLVNLKEQWEKRGGPLEIVSGGNSSSINMVLDGSIPIGVNHLRLGESILLGRETIQRSEIRGTHSDAFLIRAEVVELKEKPSLPVGELTRDAFGCMPSFTDRGIHRRAVLAIGRQDIDLSLQPVDRGIEILGASSDHLLLDATAAANLQVGDIVDFIPGYGALLAVMTSPYVEKVYV